MNVPWSGPSVASAVHIISLFQAAEICDPSILLLSGDAKHIIIGSLNMASFIIQDFRLFDKESVISEKGSVLVRYCLIKQVNPRADDRSCRCPYNLQARSHLTARSDRQSTVIPSGGLIISEWSPHTERRFGPGSHQTQPAVDTYTRDWISPTYARCLENLGCVYFQDASMGSSRSGNTHPLFGSHLHMTRVHPMFRLR